MFVRRRPLLRAAAVGGAAYVAGKHVARNRADQQYTDEDQEARISALEQQQAPGYGQPPPPGYGQPPPPGYGQPPPAGPGPAGGSSIADQLNQLVELHKQGALTDEEFAAAKAGVLGGSG
jgi:Short C-terminal domain